MTDSEEEHEIDESISVAYAAEAVAILVIGCVAGIKGLGKVRKGKTVCYIHLQMSNRLPKIHKFKVCIKHLFF